MVRGAEPVRGPPSGLKLVLPEASRETDSEALDRPAGEPAHYCGDHRRVSAPAEHHVLRNVGHHLPLDRALDRVLKPLDQHVLGLLKGHRFGSVETFDARTMMIADD